MEMKYFFELYEAVDRLGPGSEKSTTDALKRLSELSDNTSVLDVGCGCGAQTLVLAKQLSGPIVAVDNHQPFLDKLQQRLNQRGLSGQVTPQAASMLELPFADQSFDLIWSEGAVYIMGFTEGLRELETPTEIRWTTGSHRNHLVSERSAVRNRRVLEGQLSGHAEHREQSKSYRFLRLQTD